MQVSNANFLAGGSGSDPLSPKVEAYPVLASKIAVRSPMVGFKSNGSILIQRPGLTSRPGNTLQEKSKLRQVLCNGHVVPLASTGRSGEYVAGVRFRAWQPAASLHPRIPVDAPLVFDIHDRWQGRAVSGCTYHVAHPGGRNFDAFPVNANAAESRRLARFHPLGTASGLWLQLQRRARRNTLTPWISAGHERTAAP
jgi:hypothetical protein